MQSCDSCGANTFGFHVCAAGDLKKVIAWQDKRIARLETKLAKRKKGKRG